MWSSGKKMFAWVALVSAAVSCGDSPFNPPLADTSAVPDLSTSVRLSSKDFAETERMPGGGDGELDCPVPGGPCYGEHDPIGNDPGGGGGGTCAGCPNGGSTPPPYPCSNCGGGSPPSDGGGGGGNSGGTGGGTSSPPPPSTQPDYVVAEFNQHIAESELLCTFRVDCPLVMETLSRQDSLVIKNTINGILTPTQECLDIKRWLNDLWKGQRLGIHPSTEGDGHIAQTVRDTLATSSASDWVHIDRDAFEIYRDQLWYMRAILVHEAFHGRFLRDEAWIQSSAGEEAVRSCLGP